MPDELIDIYDEFNNPTNIKKMRNTAHNEGLWHRSAHIWVYNQKGEILLQLRAKDKLFYPNMWDISASGHVGAGEEPITAGLREIKEEIGLKIRKEDLHFFKIKKVKRKYKNLENNEFYYVYILRFDGDISKLKLQNEEVQKIKSIPIEKFKEELKSNSVNYVPHGNYWYEAIDEIKKEIKA